MANAFSYYGMVLYTTVLLQSTDVCYGDPSQIKEASNATDFASNTTSTCVPLTNSDYIGILTTSVAEIPGLFFSVFLIEKIGRKRIMALDFALFGVAVFLLLLCLKRVAVMVLLFIARALISGAFQCAFVYTPEVYPTTLRASGLGFASGMARLGSLCTPYVAQVLSEKSISYPIIVYGGVAFTGAIASLLLPIETKGRHMQETH